MKVYYGDNDPAVAQWVRNLVAAGLLPDGDVDERSIADVRPSDLAGYTQAHFFCGIGGWPLALGIAGWPPTRHVWTGSCPCQPFSSAGRGAGEADERHLWPEFRRLIAECRPAIVFGEQVASKAGRTWLAGVRADLEAMEYAVGAADLCAASVGAPHIRQRIFWVADANAWRLTEWADETEHKCSAQRRRQSIAGNSAFSRGLADHPQDGWRQWSAYERGGLSGSNPPSERHGLADDRDSCGLGNAPCQRCEGRCDHVGEHAGGGVSLAAGPWSEYDIVWCDERAFGRGYVPRRVEPGTFPLAHGVPARLVKLRAYGNAINPYTAAEFIRAYAAA